MTPRTLTTMLFALALAACGGARQAVWDVDTIPQVRTGSTVSDPVNRRNGMLAEGDHYWALRDDETMLRNAIARYEDALAIDPAHPDEWARVSRGYFFLADGFLSDDPAKRNDMFATYERGVSAAERGLLASSPTFAERMRNGVRLADAVDLLDASATGCLYWRAQNLSRYMTSQGTTAQMAMRDEVFAMLQRETALDDAWFYGGAHRVLGKIFATAPGYAGGDPARAREQYERALEEGPQYWWTRVEYAESWAVAARDRAAFERQLRWVVAADATTDPSLAPENAAAQRHAQALLAKEDQLFR